MHGGVAWDTVIVGGVVTLAVTVIGFVVAHLLGQNAEATRNNTENTTAALAAIGATQIKHGEALAVMTGAMGPAVQELERVAAGLSDLKGDVRVLQEWRANHDVWAKESVARLDRALAARRSSDTI